MQLLLDSSGGTLVAALARDGKIASELAVNSSTLEGRDLIGVVRQLLGGISIRELDAIGVGVGPGSFIGTRVAVSFANGLAAASGLAVHSLPTLAAFAVSAPQDSVVLRDARRGEAYLQQGCSAAKPAIIVPLVDLGKQLSLLQSSYVIAESPAAADKRAAEWQAAVGLAAAGCSLQWKDYVPAAGLLSLLSECPGQPMADPTYLRGFL
jgi:tRNA threonylcarbamoyladenosine biosynthesis protein TsaB